MGGGQILIGIAHYSILRGWGWMFHIKICIDILVQTFDHDHIFPLINLIDLIIQPTLMLLFSDFY